MSKQSYSSKRTITKRIFLSAFFSACLFCASAQNINNPNKSGPLGTQVNTLSGNLFISRNDIFISARGFNLALGFYYNSYDFNEDIGYGNGWNFGYGIRYKTDTAGNKLIKWGDGREDQYKLIAGNKYKAPRGFFDTLAEYQPNKFRLQQLDGVKYFFDNAVHKRITKLEEPNGNTIIFAYTDTLLTSLVNTAGQSITFTYNTNGKLASIVDAVAAPSRTYTYTYDAAGNLKEVNDPLNGKNKYSYLTNGPMKTLSDKNNNVVDIIYYPNYSTREIIGCNKRISFSYDTLSKKTIATDHLKSGNNQITTYTYQKLENIGWITSMSGNCCGYNLLYEYDDQGNKTKETDANGNVYKYTYDARGNMLSMTDPLNQASTYTYESTYQNITSFTDPKGDIYTLTYDANGNLTQLTAPGNLVYTATYNTNGDITGSTDPKGNSYTYNYDAYGNPTNVTGPNGYSAVLSYNARGNLLSFTDARGNTHTAEFDILDRLKKITDPLNNNVRMNYDAEGNTISVINKNNETTLLNYDASNRVVKIKDPIGNQTEMTYDGMNNLLTAKNALGNIMSFSYDTRNRMTSTKDPLSNSSSYSYDNNGNITSASMANGQTVNYMYDVLNRLTAVSDNTGTIATLAYDKNNNITSFTNGTGATATATYDSLNRAKQVTDPLGNTMLYVYDKNSNITAVTDRNGFTKNYTYDSLNRVKTYTDNNGFTITVSYDAQGNMVQAKDQNNNITSYAYDNLNRVTTTTYPDSRFLQYSYDVKNNVISKRLTDGSIITYQYDSLNRVITKTLPGGVVYAYTYDALSRMITATNNNGTVTLAYDNLNRVVSENYDGRTTNYTYDIAGRTQTTIYPDSTVVTRQFDTRNRLTAILKNSNPVVSYHYNNANQTTNKTFANGISSNMQYDFANRLSSISTANGTIQNTAFTYDKERNKTSINRLNNPALSESFIYDNGYRLTNYKRGVIGGATTIQNTYSYDALGNRTNANLNGTNTIYTVNNLNQLTNSNNGSQNINFLYDNRGNLTYDGVFYKTYDAEGRLLKDSAAPASVINYSYDAFNRRVAKTTNGIPLKYTYSGLAQIEERDGSNAILNKTIFTNFLSPVLNEKSGSNFYYHSNELNSVEAISNANGRLVERYQYDVYGKPSRFDSLNNPLASSPSGNRVGFTGQEYDSASGSYRFFFRNYSPATGTFNQRDLIGYADGMGMYQYAGNNPANGIDILGLDCGDDGSDGKQLAVNEEMLAELDNLLGKNSGHQNFPEEVLVKLDNLLGKNSGHQNFSEDVLMELDGLLGKHSGHQNFPEDVLVKLDGLLGSNNSGHQTSQNQKLYDPMTGKIYGEFDNVSKKIIEYNENSNSGHQTSQSNKLYDPMTGKIYGEFDNVSKKIIEYNENNNSGHRTSQSNKLYDPMTGKIYGEFDNVSKKIIEYNENSNSGHRISQNEKFYDPTTGKIYGEYDPMTGRINPIGSSNCNKPGGTRKPSPTGNFNLNDILSALTEIFSSHDPNEMIGPEGQPNVRWVSVKDRMPYSILYENSGEATAPAKYVRITTPIEPKQDVNTFQLGNFGFNSATFTIPANTAAYYNRLDVRDSLGLFVDITAGYDQINNVAFWEFQAIDPVTLQSPSDPLKGFLLLQDSNSIVNGHGFVNFSIKPKQNALTLDTIGARAAIVFDNNDTIPTNIYTNTIDAFAPTSHMNTIAATTNPITLSWTGADDNNGCGIDYYTIYVSTDHVNYSVLIPKITSTDTTLILPPDTSYCFFVLATDRVGNKETLRPGEIKCTYIGPPLPVTWLYFRGKTVAKNNILDWATASEQNSKQFDVERSLTGISASFSKIGTVNAAGNSSSTKTYQYNDRDIDRLNSEYMFYRLKQVDIDGHFKYSNIVRLQYNKNNTTNSIIYPNPTPGKVTILIGDNALIGTDALVYDINGRLVETVKITTGSQQVNLSRYANGVYFIKLNNSEVFKVIKN